MILTDPDRRKEVVLALRELPGRVLDVAPVGHGLIVESPDQKVLYPRFTRPSPIDAQGEAVEQFFLKDGGDRVAPYIFVLAAIHFDEQRSGTRHTVHRNIAAPMDLEAGRIEWDKLRNDVREDLDLSPSSQEESPPDSRSVETARVAAEEGREHLHQTLLENEVLVLFFNRDLDLYSRPDESRESFRETCREEFDRRMREQVEKLDGSYRRRLDQIRERFQKLLRDESEASSHDLEEPDDSGIPWGQIHHDITSGKEVHHDKPRNAMESDCFLRIGELQKSWHRDQAEIEEDLARQRENIEEIKLSPKPKDVELVKYFVVWAESLGAFDPKD